MTSQETFQLWYLTHYNRAADQTGLTYWLSQLESGESLETLCAAFTSLEQPEAATRWANTPSESFISQLYQQLLNREANSEEIAYWQSALDSQLSNGASFSQAGSNIAQAFATAALENAEDSALLTSKLTIAAALTAASDADGPSMAALSREYLDDSGLGLLSASELTTLVASITTGEATDGTTSPVLPSLPSQPGATPEEIRLDDGYLGDDKPFSLDASDVLYVLFDSVEAASNTAISGYSADDTLVLEGVSAEDVRVSVFEGNTLLQFDDGEGAVSQITLVGVDGFFTSVAAFNAASGLGDITFA